MDSSRRIFGLAPTGVCRAVRVTVDAVSSYLTVSPLLLLQAAVCSLWHFPSRPTLVVRAQALPGSLSNGARTFLVLVPEWYYARSSNYLPFRNINDRDVFCLRFMIREFSGQRSDAFRLRFCFSVKDALTMV